CTATNPWGVGCVRVLAPAPTMESPSGSGFQGTTVSMTLSGTGFYDPGADYPNHLGVTIGGAGISNYVISYNGPTSATAKFDISASAAVGFRNIVLTNPDGQVVTVTSGFEVKSNIPPALANIESSALVYNDNDAATPLTPPP